MTVKEATVARFQELMKTSNIKINELATRSGVTPSSVYSMLNSSRKEVSVNLVKKLCDGLDMTLGEFFSAPVYDELEQGKMNVSKLARVCGLSRPTVYKYLKMME